jgi:predicted kinase
MEKATQYILCGIPFSGKSTLGKELAKRLGFVHINLDQLKKEKGYGKVSDDDVPDNVWKIIFQEADKKLIDTLKSGKNVANETAWVTRKWRDRARKVAADAGFASKIIWLTIDEVIVRNRWQQNRKKTNRYDTFDKEFNDYVNDFEPPTRDEDIIIYDQTIPVDEWIKKNFSSEKMLR